MRGGGDAGGGCGGGCGGVLEAIEQRKEEKEVGEGRERPVLKLNARAPCSHRQRFHGYRVILASKEISFTLV